MSTDILDHDNILTAADETHIFDILALGGGYDSRFEADSLLVCFHFVVVLFSEVIFIPFELFEKEKTPSFFEVDDGLYFL